ncbi:MAG: hypothetical protein QY311_01750 [Candidatus Paceibacterota bacterium]|nr:MAG: hypothetical protein QY311_01750 [Candidatus Paceibacterota bacterium]
MICEIGRSNIGSGLDEALRAGYVRRDVLTEDAHYVCDASSPVPNCRATELLVAAWASLRLPGTVVTDISTAGTVGEYGQEWGLDADCDDFGSNLWKEFWGDVPFIGKERLRPHVPIGLLPDAVDTIISTRLARFMEVRERLVEHIVPSGMPAGSLRVRDLTCALINITLGELREALPSRRAICRVPCPACSADTVSYHSVRWDWQYVVTAVHSTRPMRCKGARILSACISDDTSVGLLMRKTGLVLNGLAAYAAIKKITSPDARVHVRDYSDSRGTLNSLTSLWRDRLSVSTRVTVVTPDKKDAGWDDLRRCLDAHASRVGKALSDIPFISDGRTITITVT